MTTDPFALTLTCPSGLIAACAPLLGFTPERCLVIFVHGVPGRLSPVVVRVDLQPEATGVAPPRVLAARTALSIETTGGAAADMIAWIDDPDDSAARQLSSAALLRELTAALTDSRIEVGAILSTNGVRWWSHSCDDPACCPQGGTALDSSAMDRVRAEFVFAGVAPLTNREQLADRVRRDESASAAVERVLGTRPAPNKTPRWRDTQIRLLSRLLLPTPELGGEPLSLTPVRAAGLHRALGDVRVRDVMVHRLACSGSAWTGTWSRSIETLCLGVRGAPDGHVAPVATLLALVAWMRGEGALANLSLDRAAEEPGYRLAELAAELIGRGVDPRAWQATLGGITEAECLYPRRS